MMSVDGGRPERESVLSAEDQARLDRLYRDLEECTGSYLGYPTNAKFDYADLLRFLKFPLNNIGDPFQASTYLVSTRALEREVLQWFAELTHAQEQEYWGYVTNGGTEGNMYGLYLARELFPSGVVYYSQDTHYSVSKSLRVLRMQHIMIRSLPNGEIDYEDLYETLRIHRDLPPIILANIGTTMKEAVDDVVKIRQLLSKLAIPVSYIHADAALSGMTLPFVEGAPEFDFRAGVDSIAISGHKLIGSPVPCGVVLARRGNVDRIARSIEYVGTLDTTISGSRNGFTPLVLWYAIRKIGMAGYRALVKDCLGCAEYAVEQLCAAGIPAWKNPYSITVVLPRVPREISSKWQLAVQGDWSHIIVLPHVTREIIDRFVADLKAMNSAKAEE